MHRAFEAPTGEHEIGAAGGTENVIERSPVKRAEGRSGNGGVGREGLGRADRDDEAATIADGFGELAEQFIGVFGRASLRLPSLVPKHEQREARCVRRSVPGPRVRRCRRNGMNR
jgi:hypothetical protein